MSSYLASNQPYQKVDDGIGAGLLGGAVVGGALAGSAHRWGDKGIDGLRSMTKNRLQLSEDQMRGTMSREGVTSSESIGAQKSHYKNVNRGTSVMKGLHGVEGLRNKGFGGSKWGKAAAYGGSILAGGILGGVGDAIND